MADHVNGQDGRLNAMEGIDFLREYRANPGKYLPLSEDQYKHFEKWEDEIIRNHCWGAGLLEGNRPYFAECWSIFGVSTITVLVSAEDAEGTDIVRMIQEAGLVECVNPEKAKITIKKATEENGNVFYGINTVTGSEKDGQYLFWKGPIHTYEELDELNGYDG